jgi:hypothetical protein
VEGDLPSATTRKPGTLVRRLRNQVPDPGFYICRVLHVVVVDEDLCVLYQDVDHAGVFEVLAETTYRDAVSTVTSDLFGE